jgi:seryl-tRNA synthetase
MDLSVLKPCAWGFAEMAWMRFAAKTYISGSKSDRPMLEINFIRTQTDLVKKGLAKKHFKDLHLVDELLQVDEQRRKVQQSLEEIRNKENQLAKEIGDLFKQGKKEDAEQKKAQATGLKEESARLTDQLAKLEGDQKDILVRFPNLPHSSVPEGKTPEENEVVKLVGEIPALFEGALPHWELAKKYDLFDLELGVKTTVRVSLCTKAKARSCSGRW